MNFYISDLHFSHKNIIPYDNRPFFNLTEMHEALISNWNNAVKNEDSVYILGDFHWGKKKEWIEVLQQLNGKKHLVFGNHDDVARKNDGILGMFESFSDYMEIKDNGRNVVLCHFPIPCYKNMYYGWYHLYGHVHNMVEHNIMENCFNTIAEYYGFVRRAFNVGCMMPYMNFTPQALDHIIAR